MQVLESDPFAAFEAFSFEAGFTDLLDFDDFDFDIDLGNSTIGSARNEIDEPIVTSQWHANGLGTGGGTDTSDDKSQKALQQYPAFIGPSPLLMPKKRKRKGPVSKYLRNKNPVKPVKAINMSRCRATELVVFPAFDKCDSLVFFPTAMSRLLNSGDFKGFGKLVYSHFDKKCLISYKGTPVSAATTVKWFALVNELHPDMLMCVRETKVVDDFIEAVMFSKFTDSPALFAAFQRQVRGTADENFITGTRAEHLKKKFNLDTKSPVDRFRLNSLAESDLDLTVHGTMALSLRVDQHTRKVTSMDYRFAITSVQPAQLVSSSSLSP